MIELLVETALAAGRIILPFYRNGTAASAKADGSPVTEADARAEALILEHLNHSYPDIPIVAEEAAAAGSIPEIAYRFFLVDPLDGTKEFVSGSGDFTVNIGLIEDGRPVMGVVYAPALGRIFAGGIVHGAREAQITGGGIGPWQPMFVRQPPDEGIVVVASKSHLTSETKNFIEGFRVTNLISAGSSLKFCQVASGEADLYPRMGRTMEWDTAAADAVLRAAGGMVWQMNGQPLAYGKRDQADDCDFANPWFVASGGLDPFKH